MDMHGLRKKKKTGDYINQEACYNDYCRESQDSLIIDIYLMLFPSREF